MVLKRLKGWWFHGLEEELRANLLIGASPAFTKTRSRIIPCFHGSSLCWEPKGRRLCTPRWSPGPGRLAWPEATACARTRPRWRQHPPSQRQFAAGRLPAVLSRSLKKIRADCCEGGWRVVDHARATKYRLLEDRTAARLLNEAGQQRLKKSYGRYESDARGNFAGRRSSGRALAWRTPCAARCGVAGAARAKLLHHYLPLVERVIAQTQARVFEAQSHYPEKVLSLFEAHSVVIRKGKPHKPNEFERLVRIHEIENGILSGYEVAAGNRIHSTTVGTALQRYVALFGRAPRLATADHGYPSAQMSAWLQNWEMSR